jgi:DNA-binding CsgD family transcriptional regulator
LNEFEITASSAMSFKFDPPSDGAAIGVDRSALGDWLSGALSEKHELIAELDRTADEATFGEALLRVTQAYGIDSIVAGLIRAESLACGGLECTDCCTVNRSLPKRPVKGKPANGSDMRVSNTHCFSRDIVGSVKHLVCNPDFVSRPPTEKQQEILFAVMSSMGVHWGVAFYGRKIPDTAATQQTLAFIAYYAFARMVKIEKMSLRPHLPPRQMEVLKWASEGKTDQEIAIILEVSGHTVDKYMRQIKETLNASNRTAAIVLAMRFGLLI